MPRAIAARDAAETADRLYPMTLAARLAARAHPQEDTMDISQHPFVIDLLGGAIEVKRVQLEALHSMDIVDDILDEVDAERERDNSCMRRK